VNAQGAVHEWMLQSEAMREMQEQHRCFVPMVERIAELLLTAVGRGVKLRVLICALLSYLDVISDVTVIQQYIADGQLLAAQASLSFLGANLVLQIGLCITQNYRNPKEMTLEILYTLICLKPALEVLRIVKGEQKKAHQTFHLITENSYAKAIEVFAEAGPAAFLQMFFMLQVAHPTFFQYLSIAISVATAAFTIASMDYNLDTEPKFRGIEPHFFGLVPDRSEARIKILAAMFINAFVQMAAVVIGTASLIHIDPRVAIGMWCGRMGMMFVIKLAQRDFSYYIPISGLPGIMIAAFIERPCVTFLSDIGPWAYSRHPYELGCVQWWFGRLWPWVLLIAAIVLRVTTSAELGSVTPNSTAATSRVIFGANTTAVILDGTSSPVPSNGTVDASSSYGKSVLTDPIVLLVVAAVLFVVWLLSLAAFFLLAKREYWPTFWNNETAAEYTKRVKWDGQADERLRALLLVKVHPSLLRLVFPEARIWIAKNWKRWSADSPDFFNDRWKRGLPDTLLSRQVLKELGGQNRRRSTLSEQLGVGEPDASPGLGA
jgi:hypothetical protein